MTAAKKRNRITEEKERLRDLDLLARVRVAAIDDLLRLRANHAHGSAPPWKRIAIERAIFRLGGETVPVPTTGGVWRAIRW